MGRRSMRVPSFINRKPSLCLLWVGRYHLCRCLCQIVLLFSWYFIFSFAILLLCLSPITLNLCTLQSFFSLNCFRVQKFYLFNLALSFVWYRKLIWNCKFPVKMCLFGVHIWSIYARILYIFVQQLSPLAVKNSHIFVLLFVVLYALT